MVDFLLPESDKDQGENPMVDSLAVPLLLPPGELRPASSQEMSTGLSSWKVENFLSQVTCSSPPKVTVQL